MNRRARAEHYRYIEKTFKSMPVDVNFKVVNERDGFYYSTIFEDGDRIYCIDIEDKRLSLPVKLAIRHEVGHILLRELWIKDEQTALDYVNEIERENRFFAFLQKIYYWNPVLRWLKRKAGFSSKITYTKNDIAYSDGKVKITRRQDELAADHFAVLGPLLEDRK